MRATLVSIGMKERHTNALSLAFGYGETMVDTRDHIAFAKAKDIIIPEVPYFVNENLGAV